MIPAMTLKELAAVAGYTYRRLHDIDENLPDNRKLFVKSEDGKKYDLAQFVQRWVSYNVDKAVGDGESLDEVKAAHEQIKMRKTELEVEKMEGRLVDVRDVILLWTSITGTIMQNMLNLPAKIAPRVAGIASVDAVAATIDEEVRIILNGLADTPLPDYANQGTSANNEGEDSSEEE